MLTREFLQVANCQSSFGTIDGELLLTSEQRSDSLQRFLETKPDNGPVWVFGYGSLMWNPLLQYNQVKTGELSGWQRAFCLRLIAGRATAEQPGRMLALVPGGATKGRLFKLNCQCLEQERSLLWKREMLTGCYHPTWQTAILASGERVSCLVFVANSDHPLFEKGQEIGQIAPLIARASGPLGNNACYLVEMIKAFQRFAINEPELEQLQSSVSKLLTESVA